MTKRIAYFGSCWPTNIGNAFVNLGAKHSLKKALGDRFQLIHFGGMSSYLFRKRNLPQNNLNLAKMTKCDYVVMAGMTQCIDHFQSAENIIKEFIDCGARVVIAGGGAQNYDDDEVAAVRNYMSELPIYVFVSRDTYSFQKYGDLAAHRFDGIDSAFFIADSECEMIPLELSEFDVLTFDQMDEPALINVGDSERIEAVNQSFDDSNQ